MVNMRNFGAKRLAKAGGAVAPRTVALAAASLAILLGVSACEERPYPQPMKTAAEQPQAPAPLAGAPTQAPSQAPTYAAPRSAPAYTASAPTYAPSTPAYSSGAIVAMAPIPNPDEYGRRGAGHRVHSRYDTAQTGEGYAAAPRPGRETSTYGKPAHRTAPVYAAAAPKPSDTKPAYTKPAPAPVTAPVKTYAAAKPVSPPKPAYVAKAPAPMAVMPAKAPAKVIEDKSKVAAAATAAAAVAAADKAKAAADKAADKAKVTAAMAADKAKVTAAMAADKAKAAADKAKSAAAAAPAKMAAAAKPAMNAADRATRLAAVQSALTDAISKNATLKTPDRFTANQPVDVTLTVPASFSDTLKTEADKNGLSDAAASANLTAVLSGDGFSVTPDETLSLPLAPGQPTEFKWTVTALPNAKGPLHADVGVDLLGGGSDTLTLGSVQKQAGLGIKPTARVIGLGLLVLIALLIVGWLARGRGPSRPASARRAARAARNRPMDMGTNETAH